MKKRKFGTRKCNGSKKRSKACRTKKHRTHKRKHRISKRMRRGGTDDLEMGPEIKDIQPYPVPPDPERFKRLEERMRMRPGSPEEVDAVFSGPTPEQKQEKERSTMGDEDPLNKDPFDNEKLTIFSSEGGRRRHK